MKDKLKTTIHGLYWRQFGVIAGMVLLTMLLLGMAFFALSYTTNVSEKRQEMRQRGELIAQMSAEYLTAEKMSDPKSDEAFRVLANVATRMTDVTFLICDEDGSVLLTTDENLAGKFVQIPGEITAHIREKNIYEGRNTINGIYAKKHFVVGLPMTSAIGEPMGFVLSVVDMEEFLEIWRSFVGLFFMTSAIILLIAVLVSSLMTMRQIQPITEMVQATRNYADGNFDIRMSDPERNDEFGELARAFNAMADSLQETERQRRDFIANVSHELKTPMTTIAGYTDGILDGTIPPEKERQYLQIISDESRRLSRLVRRMLDISQIQAKGLKMGEFDLCESMRIALLSMEQKITDRNLDVEAAIPEDSVMVHGDNDLITQVIYNLLENAAKFATTGTALYLGLQLVGEKARVTVRNYGKTIPPEEIPLLFERFHKTDKSRSEDKDGYGLGLYVVKTILHQHREQIRVTSENGVTAFEFTLPISTSVTLHD